MSILDIVTTYKEQIGVGLMTTLELCLIAWVGGIVSGVLLGGIASRFSKDLGKMVRSMSFVFSSIPTLVVLFWLHYPLQSLLGVVFPPFYTAAFTLLLLNTFAVAEAVRSAMEEFPQQYVTAGKVCGMKPGQIFRYIELPILMRQLVAPLLTIQIGILHATLFASLISVEEIFRVSQRINSMVYAPVPVYTTLGIFFLAICLPLTLFAAWFKQQFTRNLYPR